MSSHSFDLLTSLGLMDRMLIDGKKLNVCPCTSTLYFNLTFFSCVSTPLPIVLVSSLSLLLGLHAIFVVWHARDVVWLLRLEQAPHRESG